MPRAAVRQQTAKLEGDGHHAHADDETRLRQLGYKQVLLLQCACLLARPCCLGMVPNCAAATCYLPATRRSCVAANPHLRSTVPLHCHPQELRRELNLLRNFAVSFGLLSMLTGESDQPACHTALATMRGCFGCWLRCPWYRWSKAAGVATGF